MPAIRSTKAEIKRLTTNPSTKQIIDGLWRAPLWMHDEVLLSPDDEAKTEAGASFDARYVYVENSFLDADNNQVSFASAEGFGNSMQASFAHVIGHFNVATSFAETIIGFHGFVSETQNAHEWVVTDRLVTIANGAEANNPSDCLHIYKSGYGVSENAFCFGEYMHGNREPLDGTIQFNGAFSGYYNEAWHTFATAEQLSGLHPAVTLDPNSSNELYLYDNQIIGIDLSAYAKTANIHPAVSLGTGSETELALNPTTQVLTLTGLKKTFLSLNDTFDAYPTQGYGNGLIAGTSAVGYSNSFGVDSEGFWAKRNKSFQSESVDLDFNIYSGYAHWTYGSEPYVWQTEQLADEYHSYRAAGWYYNTIKSTTIGWLPSANGFSNYNDLGAITSPDSFDLKKSDANGDIDYTIYILNLTGGSVKLYFSKVGGSSTLIGTLTPAYAQVKFFHIPEDGEYYITIEPLSTGIELGNIFCYCTEVAITDVYSEGIRVVDSAHQTQVIYPTHAGAAGDVCVLDDDGVTMVFKPLSESLTGVVLDTDFPTAGLMLTDGAGNYSVIDDNSATWNTALVDADFASNGIMVRTGTGAYSTVADNSATWNTLASLGTKAFWNGTQAAYDAIGTKDSNTIYFINV